MSDTLQHVGSSLAERTRLLYFIPCGIAADLHNKLIAHRIMA